VGVRTCSDQSVTSGELLPDVHVSPENRKAVRPRGSQRGSHGYPTAGDFETRGSASDVEVEFRGDGPGGLTGWSREVAKPVARAVARKTGRQEPEILSLIGAVFLAIALIDFLRNVDAVIAAGRTGSQPAGDAPARA
jgi:hypothetical protein